MSLELASLDLDGDDFVTFPECIVDGDTLRDSMTGEVLALNPMGVAVVLLCDGSRTWDEVVDAIASRHGLDRLTASADLFAFVTAAERRSLVHIVRSWRARLRPDALHRRARDLLSLAPTRLERRRFPANIAGITYAAVRALRLPLALAVVVWPLSWLGLITQGVDPTQAVLAASMPLAVVTFVGITMLGHELGHLALLTREARDRVCVVADHLTVVLNQVEHPSDTSGLERRRAVAAAGPLLGLTLALAAAGAIAASGSLPDAFVWGAVGIGLGHLASLLPWAHDGKHVWRRVGGVR